MNRKTLDDRIRWKPKFLGVGLLFVLAVGIATTNWQQAQASSSWMTKAETLYPTIVGTPLDDCSLCHTSVPALNPYGSAFAKNSHSFTAIENLDSDGDGYTNLAEINAHTFPGDINSHPVTSPTATPVPPTATRTQVPPTATQTQVPPTATSTNTRIPPSATPTNTPIPATATRVPPTATSVNKLPPPTATATRGAPTATSTLLPPTPPSTRTTVPPTKTPTKTVPASHPVVFRDVIRQLPSTQTLIGDWQVGNRTVHVTSQTKISRDDDDAVKLGMSAVVKGNVLSDGSVAAMSIRVQDDDIGKRFRAWIRDLGERLHGLMEN